MNIKELGGEFKLIERITRRVSNRNVIVGIGDDAAVIRFGGKNLVITSDMICEGDHFSRAYFTPRQIGIKAMNSNLSDIAAMGGRPLYALSSIALSRDTDIETMDGFYGGLYDTAMFYGVDIIGGDTTHSSVMVICLTLLGEVKPNLTVLRSGAKPGDIIKVTGELGGSTAGLRLFLKKIDGFDEVKLKHTEPRCRLDVSDTIACMATAMEDVSDGLASEVRNICRMSGTGAVIFKDKIPINDLTFKAASTVGEDAFDYALYGGEDFELVYTVPKDRIDSLPGTVVGEIIEEKNIYLEEAAVLSKVEKFGFDHFA